MIIEQLLDQTYEQVRDGENIGRATAGLAFRLCDIRLGNPDAFWDERVRPACAAHPLNQIYLEDPYTRRAREKPRGYAGDAVMLDYLFSRQAPRDISPIGRRVFDCTTSKEAGQCILWRRDHLAVEIDNAAALFGPARVLSLACGHLREAEASSALRTGQVEVLHAIDQDNENLAVVRRDYGHLKVSAVNGSLRQALGRKLGIASDSLHLAYSAGLYDYLAEPVAQALTLRLFDLLAPGGKLIVPNFLTTNHARGYMESFMDWNLVVRDRAQIERLGALVPETRIAERTCYEDPFGVVGYLEIVKRS